MQDRFYREIEDFLLSGGVHCEEVRAGSIIVLKARLQCRGLERELYILPAGITARTPEEAMSHRSERLAARKYMESQDPRTGIVTVAEDRWRRLGEMYRRRLLAHLGDFRSIFARKCRAIRTDRATANAFLEKNHDYGAAVCRHCYCLEEIASGRIVAAATFSNARKWQKGDREIRSYEWVRYASEAGIRIPGGMGKLLSTFINEVKPDDIMSYADLEWSDGEVYRKLGFSAESTKSPVMFDIDTKGWSRTPVPHARYAASESRPREGHLWYLNEGSLKYRLKLTDYQE